MKKVYCYAAFAMAVTAGVYLAATAMGATDAAAFVWTTVVVGMLSLGYAMDKCLVEDVAEYDAVAAAMAFACAVTAAFAAVAIHDALGDIKAAALADGPRSIYNDADTVLTIIFYSFAIVACAITCVVAVVIGVTHTIASAVRNDDSMLHTIVAYSLVAVVVRGALAASTVGWSVTIWITGIVVALTFWGFSPKSRAHEIASIKL